MTRRAGVSLKGKLFFTLVAFLSLLGVVLCSRSHTSFSRKGVERRGTETNVEDDVFPATDGRKAAEAVGDGGATLISTKSGQVQGFRTNGTVAFLGIPYAEPPVGDLRLESPFPNKPWAPQVLNATQFSPGCPQTCKLPEIMCPPAQSEDCLYLNVYTPDKPAPEGGWPVYVFIHGGAFQNGAAGSFAYVGFGFAANDVVLVAMNYRLGAFGFLTYEGIPGNFGFQDQIRAMEWVQENIGSFGGDKTRVTLGGESAGAVSVMCHLTSPVSQGLFTKAIVESSPIALPFSKTKDNRFYDKFVDLSGCDTGKGSDVKGCLKEMSSGQIVKLMDQTASDIFPFPNPDIIPMPWTPSIGTVDLPEHPYVVMTRDMNSQMISKVPVLVGGNLQDARIFVRGFANYSLNPVEYDLAILFLFGKSGAKVLELYPSEGSGDQKGTIEKVVTDYLFQCLGRFVADKYRSIGQPAYLYDFEYPTRLFWGYWGRVCDGHPCHGGELMFVFNNINSNATICKDATQEERNVAIEMNEYWSNFIKTGDPNANGEASWPLYDAQNQQNWMNFSTAIPATPITNFKTEQCDLFDKIGYYREPSGPFLSRLSQLPSKLASWRKEQH